MCVCVFPDCPGVTENGLQHINDLAELRYLTLRDMPNDWLTAAVLKTMHGCPKLWLLTLGKRYDREGENIPAAAAVAGSVRLHTQTAYHIDGDTLTQPLLRSPHAEPALASKTTVGVNGTFGR